MFSNLFPAIVRHKRIRVLKKPEKKEKETKQILTVPKLLKELDQIGFSPLYSTDYEGNARGWIKSKVHVFNLLIGGGLPRGRIVEIYGEQSGGKTAVSLSFAAACQQIGGISVFIDSEQAASPIWFQNIGVDIKSLRYIQSTPDRILTVESVYSYIEKAVKLAYEKNPKVPVVIIWDSVAGTPTEAELKADYTSDLMAPAARRHSQGLRKITQYISATNAVLVLINQTRAKFSQYGHAPDEPPGGKAIRFYSSVRIKVKKVYGGEHRNSRKEIIGSVVELNTVKNKVARPYRSVKADLFFDERGWDVELSLFHYLKETEKIVTSGPKQVMVLPISGEIKFFAKEWLQTYEKYKDEILKLSEA